MTSPDDLTVGESALVLRGLLEEIPVSRSILGSLVFSLNALDLAAREADHDGWDGYEGVALDRRSYARARRILLELPPELASPDVEADPRGGVLLSWRPAPDTGFVIAIRREGYFTYAGQSGQATVHGREPDDDALPAAVLEGLIRMVASESGIP
jgi:hypothetical protein